MCDIDGYKFFFFGGGAAQNLGGLIFLHIV